MNTKIEEIVATLREYAPDADGTQRYSLIPAAGRGGVAEYPVTVIAHRTDIMRDAADLIEQLQQELIDERYRHDRYADFCVAQGEELSALKKKYMALLEGEDDWYDDRNDQRELTDEQRKLVDYIQTKVAALAKADLISFHEPSTMSGEPIQFVKYGSLPKVPKEDAHGSND